MARLDHPNIVPIHEVGEQDGQLHYSMKLVEGGSLTQHLPRLAQDHRAAVRLLVPQPVGYFRTPLRGRAVLAFELAPAPPCQRPLAIMPLHI